MPQRFILAVSFGRSVIMPNYGRPKTQEVENFRSIFVFFLKKRPLTVKFSKFCSESLHGDTDRRCCVQKSLTLATGKSAKSCVIYLTDKINSLGSHAGATAWIAPKIGRGQPQQSSLSVPNVIQIGSLSAEL